MGAHEHRKAQLVYSPDGVLRVVTGAGTFVVPPEWAVWVPSWVRHDVQASTPLTLRSVYVEPESAINLPDRCCVVSVPPLLRELILESATLPDLYEVGGPDGRLMAVILDRITALEHRPVVVPQVHDELLLPIADALTADPADPRGLDDWGRALGASGRTLSRRFIADVGMPFATWRRQVRLLAALEHLAAGEPVSAVAFAVGYGVRARSSLRSLAHSARRPAGGSATMPCEEHVIGHDLSCVTRPRRPMLLTSTAITVTR
jgi:AraC-like DNA-binding protein